MKRRTALLAAMCIALACGGTSSPEEAAKGSTPNLSRNTFRVGGTISGLSGTVVLEDNGGDNLIRSVNGSFTFTTALPRGSSYLVTVLAQPAGQTCAVANGSGTIAGSNVTNVAVSCTTNPVYTVSGTISGLSGAVTLQDNGGDNLTASANGLFTFLTGLQNGSSYSVTVLAQPSGQTCAVANGSGTVSAANVTNVAVNCTVNGFNTVGGTVSGLSGVVTLQDNGGDNLDVGANGAFTFATALASGSAYAVTILTQPFFQTCTVANASGVIAGANVTDVAVSCLTTGGFFTGYCEVDPVTGLLTGACWDPGNCFDGLSPYCSGPPLNPVVQPFCGPLLDSTFCIF